MRIKLIQHQSCNNRSKHKSHHFGNHNSISLVIITNTSHIRVIIIGVDNNKSTNKCTTVNKGIRSTTTDSKYNKESTFDSIKRTIYNTNRSNGLDNTY
jgi:hypothetical protein